MNLFSFHKGKLIALLSATIAAAFFVMEWEAIIAPLGKYLSKDTPVEVGQISNDTIRMHVAPIVRERIETTKATPPPSDAVAVEPNVVTRAERSSRKESRPEATLASLKPLPSVGQRPKKQRRTDEELRIVPLSPALEKVTKQEPTQVDASEKKAAAKLGPLEEVQRQSSLRPRSIEGDIILDVFLRSKIVYQGMLCIGKEGRTYLPISQIFGIVGFPITVSETGAAGWFITERRKFNFSVQSGVADIEGRQIHLPASSYFYSEDDIYMDVEQLSKLLPMQFVLDLSALTLNILPTEYLPLELMKIRQGSRRVSVAKNGLRYPLQDLDYAAIAPPRLDAKVSLGYMDQNGKQASTAGTSGFFRGDILYMSTAIYGTVSHSLTGSKSSTQFRDFSLSSERRFLDNPYLTKITIGDVAPAPTPFGSGGSLERGVRLTNQQLSATSTSDTRSFTGKALPGWDVELYRNYQLVGFQTVGSNGTYLFENIALNYGTNRFKLVMYGSEGQKEIREEVITIGSSLQRGDVEYDASLTQQGVGVFNKENSAVRTVSKSEEGKPRAQTRASFGLGNGIALRTGMTRDTFKDVQRNVGSVGLSGGFKSVLGQVDVGHSSYGSTFTKASVRGQSEGGKTYNFDGAYQTSKNYEENSVKHYLSGSMNDDFKLTEAVRAAYGLYTTRTTALSTNSVDSVYYDIGGSLGFFTDFGHFNTNVNSRIYQQNSPGETQAFYGTSTFFKPYKNGSVRGSVEYGVDKENGTHFKTVSATGNLKVNDKLSTSVTVGKYLVGDKLSSVSNTWSYSLDTVTPYIQATWTSSPSYSIYAGFSVSFDLDPTTYTPKISKGGSNFGGASCLVYNDTNYNNVFDNGDQPLEKVVLKAHQSNQIGMTDENGRATFYRLQQARSTDISVDARSVQDLRLYPKGGVAITPRAGKIYDLEFPMHVTGSVEGYIYLLANDQAVGKPLVPLEIVTESGQVLRSAWTEQDGFFCMENLLPGNYTIRVESSFLESKAYVTSAPLPVKVTIQGEPIRGANIFYGKAKTFAILEEKFKTKLLLGDDVQHFADYTNIDSPVRRNSQNNALITNGEQSKTLSASSVVPTGGPVPSKQQSPGASPVAPSDGLVVDTFLSESSAKEAVQSYRKKYKDLLAGRSVGYQRNGIAYAVFVKGIRDSRELSEISVVFACRPILIKLAK